MLLLDGQPLRRIQKRRLTGAAALVCITVHADKKFGRERTAYDAAPIITEILVTEIFFQFTTFIAMSLTLFSQSIFKAYLLAAERVAHQ